LKIQKLLIKKFHQSKKGWWVYLTNVSIGKDTAIGKKHNYCAVINAQCISGAA
jgi:hypothetical protein